MADYYVHLTSGSDGNDGTAGSPWLTINKFLTTVTGSTGPHHLNIAGDAVIADPLTWTTFAVGWPNDRPLQMQQWEGNDPAVLRWGVANPEFLDTSASRNKLFLNNLEMHFSSGLAGTINLFQCHLYRVTMHTYAVDNLVVASNGNVDGCHFISHGTGRTPGWGSNITVTDCVLDARDSGNQALMTNGATTAQFSHCLFMNGNMSGWTVAPAAATWVFRNCTFTQPPTSTASGIFSGMGGGVIERCVFLGGDLRQWNIHGGVRVRDTYVHNKTIPNSQPIPMPSTNIQYWIDWGGNTFGAESPYRDWENLDFTVTKPDLITVSEHPLNSVLAAPDKRYAGAFAPSGGGISWPLIRRIAAMGDLRFGRYQKAQSPL